MLGSLFFLGSAISIRPTFTNHCSGPARFTFLSGLLTAPRRATGSSSGWSSAWDCKTSIRWLSSAGDCHCDPINTGASASHEKMDLARSGDRCWHRSAKYHLASSARLADLGVAERNCAEQQERRPHSGQFFLQQITLMNPATFPLWFGGLMWLLVSREGCRYRVIAFAYLIALIEFILMHGKNYYLAGAYPSCLPPVVSLSNECSWNGLRLARSQFYLDCGRFLPRSAFQFCRRTSCFLTCAQYILKSRAPKRRTPLHCPNILPISSAGKKWCIGSTGLHGASPGERNALEFSVRITAKLAQSIFRPKIRLTTGAQRTPKLLLLGTGQYTGKFSSSSMTTRPTSTNSFNRSKTAVRSKPVLGRCQTSSVFTFSSVAG